MHQQRQQGLWAWILLMFTLWTASLGAYPNQVPDQRVYDFGNFMPDATRRQALNRELLAFERLPGGAQLAVVTVPHLEGRSIEAYSLNLFRHWGIGQAGRNNGVLLLVTHHQSRIEVGYGLEGALPEAVCQRIITQVIMPLAHDQHDPQGALEAGARELMHRLGGAGPTGPMGGPTTSVSASTQNNTFLTVLALATLTCILFVALYFFWPELRYYHWRAKEKQQRRKDVWRMRRFIAELAQRVEQTMTVLSPILQRHSDAAFFTETRRLVYETQKSCLAQLDRVEDALTRNQLEESRQILDFVARHELAFTSLIQQLETRRDRFVEAKADIASVLEATALTIAEARSYFGEIKKYGIRVSADILTRPQRLLEMAGALAHQPNHALCDPEQATVQAKEAKQLTQNIKHLWEQRLALAHKIDQALLHEVQPRLQQLRERVSKSLRDMEDLERVHDETIVSRARLKFTQAHRYFELIPRLIIDVRRENTLTAQRFDEAARLYEQLCRSFEQLEEALSAPHAMREQADRAACQMFPYAERAKRLLTPLEALSKRQDLSEAALTWLQSCRSRVAEIIPRALRKGKYDWLTLVDNFEVICIDAGACLTKAQTEIEAAKIAYAQAAAQHVRQARISHDPPTTSHNTYNDPGASYGGGDTGGSGASGGFC